ncbi:MAG TPA: SRPBCC domain-containing protein [Gemmatimonadales bacterium]|nr:SRPBCC domain-containing protein [Gemmatimonadales bacterium]
MPDIYHDFPVKVATTRVFRAVSTPADLDQWWTARCAGNAQLGAEYELWFGPTYDWRAKVTRCAPSTDFELQMTRADKEWLGTRVGFHLEAEDGTTQVRFYHVGWPAETEQYRVSCYCWAMYLRVLRRYLEHGESVPYERRLDV